MTFTERKNENPIPHEYVYETEDVFGTITIQAFGRLEAKDLDDIVLYVLRAGTESGEIVQVGTYTFKKNTDWLHEDNTGESGGVAEDL